MLLDHIDLRVSDIATARPLYDAVFSAMGLRPQNDDEDSIGYHVPGGSEDEGFVWIVQDRAHVANGTRIAFTARNRAEVDRLAGIAKTAGARAFEEAHPVLEYSADYYATFFEDACGNKFEICCRRPQ